ncbi:dnaJ homolog subfamily B member 9-like [Asterias amurensis]|uniref:dnaJ homolog subfamily B member 9-like n=1 Tax=Asterias amurensis TaxID=7602 RepID=UPI003AB3C8A1
MQYQVFLQLGAVCLSILLVKIADCKDEDYYKLLGLRRSATDKQIKKSFRKLAVLYHPDKNKDPDAEETFVKIAKAYEVLSDPEQRKLYDRLGLREYENQGNRGNAGGGSRHGGQQFNFKQFFANFDAGFEGMGSKFGGDFWGGFEEDFFSSGFPSQNRMHQHQRTVHNAHVKAHNHARSKREQRGSHDSFFGDSLFDDAHGHRSTFHSTHHKVHSNGGRTCRTVKQRVGNMITTYTDCS